MKESQKKTCYDLTKTWQNSGILDGLKGHRKPDNFNIYESNSNQFVLPIVKRFLAQLPEGFDFVYGMPEYEITENRMMF